MTRGVLPAVALAVLATAATACATEGPGARTIELRGERGFQPSAVTVRAGAKVVFDNRTARASAVSGRSAAGTVELESGRLLAYDSWAVRLDDPGTYTFGVAEDPAVIAVVEVTP